MDNRSTEFYLFLAQRVSALVLAPLIVVHLITIIFVSGENLSADEILLRTQGNYYWAFYYGLFVISASVHGAIGLRVVIQEIFVLRQTYLNVIASAVGLLVLILGFRAITILI